jgi:hypothetical protein
MLSRSQELRLKKLTVIREHLCERFEHNPSGIDLAAELKFIDNQINMINEFTTTETKAMMPNEISAPDTMN